MDDIPDPQPAHPLSTARAQLAVLYAVSIVLVALPFAVWVALGTSRPWWVLGALTGCAGLLMMVAGHALISAIVRATGGRQRRAAYDWEAPGMEHLRPANAPEPLTAEEASAPVEPLDLLAVLLLVGFPLLVVGTVLTAFG